MKTRLKKRVLLGIASVGLLLGTAWMAQAAITIVKDDGSICTSGTIKMDGTVTPDDASCSAPGSFTLTVDKTGTGAGTVTGTGFNCDTGGTDCTESYPEGTAIDVTLTATPATGSTFTGWSGACTGTGTCRVATTIAANLTVTANFNLVTSPPPPGACGALPANTVVIDTGRIDAIWPQTTNIVPPQQITAFKIHVPSDFTKRDSFKVAKTGSGLKSKLVVVSTCPGVLTPVAATGCSLAGTDTTTVRLSGKSSDPSYYCKLAPGDYYANAVSKNAVTDTGYNCSTPTNCSFYASRSAPY